MYVANRFAVDEELHSYILNHSTGSTATIYKRLSFMNTDKWIDDSMFYYKAVQLGKIKPHNVHGLPGDQRQNRMDHQLVDKDNEPSKDVKQMRSIEHDLKLSQMDYQQLEARFLGNIEFVDIFKLKQNRSRTNLSFEGLGGKSFCCASIME